MEPLTGMVRGFSVVVIGYARCWNEKGGRHAQKHGSDRQHLRFVLGHRPASPYAKGAVRLFRVLEKFILTNFLQHSHLP